MDMIGKILVISDNGGHHFVNDARESWRMHGYEVDDLKFEEVINSKLLDDYFLIIFTMDEYNNCLFNEYGKIIREKTSSPLVFSPYGNTTTEEKIALLNSVADEVIGPPTDMDLAIANCIALIRHYISSNKDDADLSSSLILDEKILLDVNRYIVQVDGKEIELRKKECDILFYLMRHKYMVMTYEQIFESVWGEEFIYTNKDVLWNQILNLRNKLQWSPNLPKYIITKRGVGYSFAPHYLSKE